MGELQLKKMDLIGSKKSFKIFLFGMSNSNFITINFNARVYLRDIMVLMDEMHHYIHIHHHYLDYINQNPQDHQFPNDFQQEINQVYQQIQHYQHYHQIDQHHHEVAVMMQNPEMFEEYISRHRRDDPELAKEPIVDVDIQTNSLSDNMKVRDAIKLTLKFFPETNTVSIKVFPKNENIKPIFKVFKNIDKISCDYQKPLDKK